jgi:hypothetical protein
MFAMFLTPIQHCKRVVYVEKGVKHFRWMNGTNVCGQMHVTVYFDESTGNHKEVWNAENKVSDEGSSFLTHNDAENFVEQSCQSDDKTWTFHKD